MKQFFPKKATAGLVVLGSCTFLVSCKLPQSSGPYSADWEIKTSVSEGEIPVPMELASVEDVPMPNPADADPNANLLELVDQNGQSVVTSNGVSISTPSPLDAQGPHGQLSPPDSLHPSEPPMPGIDHLASKARGELLPASDELRALPPGPPEKPGLNEPEPITIAAATEQPAPTAQPAPSEKPVGLDEPYRPSDLLTPSKNKIEPVNLREESKPNAVNKTAPAAPTPLSMDQPKTARLKPSGNGTALPESSDEKVATAEPVAPAVESIDPVAQPEKPAAPAKLEPSVEKPAENSSATKETVGETKKELSGPQKKSAQAPADDLSEILALAKQVEEKRKK